MHKFKKLTAAMVTAAMMMSIVPFAAFADEADEEVTESPAVVEEVEEEEEAEAEPESEEPEEKAEETETAEKAVEEEEAAPEEEKEDSSSDKVTITKSGDESLKTPSFSSAEIDDLYDEYASVKFYDSEDSGVTIGQAGKRLTGNNRKLYTLLRQGIKRIADGEVGTSKVVIPLSAFGLDPDTRYYASDLGLENLDNSTLVKEAVKSQLFGADYLTVNNPLLIDCSYEFYWIAPHVKYSYSFAGYYTYTSSTGEEWIQLCDGYVSFPVGLKYREDDHSSDSTSVDVKKTGRVMQSVENAKEIVNNASGLSDYYKLEYYKDRICELVTYNDDAAADESYVLTDSTPWALVNVFDNDKDTNVVCEGYSEAFHYLSELSTFNDSNLSVYCVTGTLYGSTPIGPHKWNIVHIGDKNYLADITNSDSGTSGANGKLFLKGYTSFANDIYRYGTTGFKYDADMWSVYDASQLELSDTDYVVTPLVTLDDIIHPVGMDLELKDDIAMNLYIETKDGLQAGDAVVITAEGKKPVEQLVSEAATTTKTDYHGKEYQVRVFTIELSAKEMTDDVKFQVKRGSVLGEEKHYSIVSYARAILAGGYDANAKNLCRAMLNYGAYAQKYFDYHADTLANADLNYGSDPIADGQDVIIPESDFIYPDFGNPDAPGYYAFVGSSLVLKSKTCLKLYFTGLTGDREINSVSCSIGSVDYKTLDNGYQVVTISGITADMMNESFNLQVILSNAEVILIQGKPMTYCHKVVSGTYGKSLTELVKSLYLYYQAAVAYQAA